MASRSKSLPLLALLILLSLGAWALSLLGKPSSPQELEQISWELSDQAASTAPSDDGPVLLAPVDTRPIEIDFGPQETRVLYPLDIELSLLQAGTVAVADDLAPPRSGANARLKGSFLAGGEALRGSVNFLYGPNQGRVLHTDQGGRFKASDLYPGISLVRIETAGVWSSERQVILRSLATANLQINFASGGLAKVDGRVVDSKGEPLANARVRLDGHVGATDHEGIFRFRGISPGKVMAVVEAPGYASYLEFLSLAPGTHVPSSKVTFRLDKEAVMKVSVAEDLGHSGPAELFLLPAVGGRDYPWHLINPIKIHRGTTQTVNGLGPGTYTALLFKAGAVAKPRRRSIRLYSDRENQTVLHLEPNQGLHGRVLVEGKPQPNVRVRLDSPDSANATLRLLGQHRSFGDEVILPHLPAGAQSLVTDSRGRFHFTTLENIDSRFYLSATSKDGRLGAKRIVSVEDKSIDLELEPVPETLSSLQIVTQTRYQGLPIKVTVQGQPREQRTVLAGDDLIIMDLPPGLWRVDSSWKGRTVLRSKQVKVRADAPAAVPMDLPRGAIEGQTDREHAKAAR